MKERVDHVKKHLEQFVGGTVLGVADDGGQTSHSRCYALRVRKLDGDTVLAWILRDPEGNGPGFLDCEDDTDGVLFAVGQRVIALRQVTEGGVGTAGDPEAKVDRTAKSAAAMFPAAYIHAEAGERGVVEYVNVGGLPTVRFSRTKTATIVGPAEVTPL